MRPRKPKFERTLKFACLTATAGIAGAVAIQSSLAAFAQTANGSKVQRTYRRSTDPPVPAVGKLGQDLFIAIGRRDLGEVKKLLSRGADPNSRNGLEFTPIFIAAASHQKDVVDALIAAGANVDAGSAYGNAVFFAASSANVGAMQTLLAKGASAQGARNDGMTALMTAAVAGAPPAIDLLLSKGVAIDQEDDNGTTALAYAARQGNDDACAVLAKAGASIDLADHDGMTPLMLASMASQTGCVKVLLANGANPNLSDSQGRNSLMLAERYGRNAALINLLKAAGAKSKSNGHVNGHRDARTAMTSGLKAVQTSMTSFAQLANCVSCHHEGLGRMALDAGRRDHLPINPALQATISGRVNGALGAMKPLHEAALHSPEAMKQVPLIEINEVTSGYTWLLAGRAAQNEPRTPGAEAMANVLARQQGPDGAWSFAAPRAPMQSSFFTFTALAVKSLKAYGPKNAETAARIRKAEAWLINTPAKSSEDRASRLLGLKWSGASAAKIREAAAQIIRDQRSDGGWSQLPNLNSDAYATGQALYALHSAGMPTGDRVYKKGTAFLLQTQDSDGTWFVNKRAFPNNNYFHAGFAHGQSEFASFNGTCWALMALSPTLQAK